jgi:hypothetical protein
MANEITLCGLTDINGLNPNGVYTLTSPVCGKDSWERVVDTTTFSVQYFSLSPTLEWHLVDDQHVGSYWAVASDAATPWQATWGNNGQPYGIPAVTEGVSVCPTECDIRNTLFDTDTEGGCNRARRLYLLGYI